MHTPAIHRQQSSPPTLADWTAPAATAANLQRPYHPRSFACTQDIAGLERIFDGPVAICIWRREPDERITHALQQLQATHTRDIVQRLDTRDLLQPAAAPDLTAPLQDFPAVPGREHLIRDIGQLVELFITLADCRHVGLRLSITTQRPCPRFHVDHVDLRLVCTWQGPATQWLEHQAVNRAALGRGAQGQPDETSGALHRGAQIHQLRPFDVAVLKGERYPGNAGHGAVHRSPAMPAGALRVMLSLDAIG